MQKYMAALVQVLSLLRGLHSSIDASNPLKGSTPVGTLSNQKTGKTGKTGKLAREASQREVLSGEVKRVLNEAREVGLLENI